VHLAIRICTITTTLVAVVALPFLALAAALMVGIPGRSTAYTVSRFGHYPPELHAVVQQDKFDMPASGSPPPLATARGANAEIQQIIFNMHSDAPSIFLRASLNVVTEPSSANRVAVASASVTPDFAGWPHEVGINRINFDIPSLAPLGFVRFCMRYPQDCNAPRSALQSVSLTEARRTELVAVNSDINHAITPHEKANVGSSDEWLLFPRKGDCKDYAITKRHTLLARGWPTRSLLLAEVVIPSGEHHLVLVVRTRESDLVLDNLTDSIRPVSQTTYRWVRAQGAKDPKFWATISVSGA